MKTVHKYSIGITGRQLIPVKVGAIPLHVGLDPNGKPCLWCKVDPNSPVGDLIEIFIVGTGHELHREAQIHLGSFVMGVYVWHVFTQDKDFPI